MFMYTINLLKFHSVNDSWTRNCATKLELLIFPLVKKKKKKQNQNINNTAQEKFSLVVLLNPNILTTDIRVNDLTAPLISSFLLQKKIILKYPD